MGDMNSKSDISCDQMTCMLKHGALRPQKPLRLIRDGEVGGVQEFLYLTPTPYTVTTRIILH